LNKIMLSPETSTLDEMQAVTRALIADGVRTFTLSFHSPSVAPGHTPYVRSQADLRQFLGRIESYCEYFLGSLGGAPGTIEGFRSSLLPGGAVA
jgi:chitinase